MYREYIVGTNDMSNFSLAIIYAAFSFGNLVSAPIISTVTAKWAMTLGATFYAIFLAMFAIKVNR